MMRCEDIQKELEAFLNNDMDDLKERRYKVTWTNARIAHRFYDN